MKNPLHSVFGAVLLLGFLAATAVANEDTLAEAQKAIDERRFDDAKGLIVPYLESNSDVAHAHYLMGRVNHETGDFDKANENYIEAIELDETVSDYYARRGSTLIQRAQTMNMFQSGPVFIRAMDQYKKAIELDSNNLHAHLGLCRYYLNAPPIGGGSMKKAKVHAEEVARLNPYLGHVERALIAKKEERSEDAIASFNEIIVINPNDTWAHYELGMLYQATGKTEEAKAAYLKTVELDPEHAEARAALEAI